jgi:hypothetical protein
MIDINKLVNDLDAADLFIRDRCGCSDKLLTAYDILILLDVAKTCDQAARVLENFDSIKINK